MHQADEQPDIVPRASADLTETIMPGVDHPEVVLRTTKHLLESVTSNIAIHLPTDDPKEPQWVTPMLSSSRSPFLNGVMRRYLLEEGVVREAEVTVEDWEKAKRDGTRVIGFNGLR